MAFFGDPRREVSLTGYFRGCVVNRTDSLGEGRVGVLIPSLMTEQAPGTQTPAPVTAPIGQVFENQKELGLATSVQTDNYIWARPTNLVQNGKGISNVGGNFLVPLLGTMVRVYFENGDPNCPFYETTSPTIAGEVVAGQQLGKGLNTQNTATNWKSTTAKPNIQVLFETAQGHIMTVDTNPNSNSFMLRLAGHTLVLGQADEGGISLQTAMGHLVHMDENSKTITLKTQSGKVQALLNDGDGSVRITNTGDFMVENQGNTAFKTAGNISLTAGGTIAFTAPSITSGS
jgi:hypothetical protein